MEQHCQAHSQSRANGGTIIGNDQVNLKNAKNMKCPFCGGSTYEDLGTMTLSMADEIIIIENVPARICSACMEQFYGENALFKVEQLRARKFEGHRPQRIVEVPVFSWEELKND